MSKPPYPDWVLVYISKVNVAHDWPEGIVVDMSQDLKDRNWGDAGVEIGLDWQIVNHLPLKVGLAYFQIVDLGDDIPGLVRQHQVWNPSIK